MEGQGEMRKLPKFKRNVNNTARKAETEYVHEHRRREYRPVLCFSSDCFYISNALCVARADGVHQTKQGGTMPKFVGRWRNAWRIRFFRDQLFVSMAAIVVAVVLLRIFLDYLETRGGVTFWDPIVSFFPAVDFRWITSSLVYSGMLLGIISVSLYPFAFLLAVRSFVLMILLRIICLFLLPLNPPPDIIPLIDPLTQWPGTSAVLTHDLFFSGYVAALAILAFTAQWKDLKIIFSSAALMVSILLLLQHTHYTIDVVAAPCFAYVAYGVAKWITVVEVSSPPASSRGEIPATQK